MQPSGVGAKNQIKQVAPFFSPAARVQAAQILLDRGWGKALQPHSGDECPSQNLLNHLNRL